MDKNVLNKEVLLLLLNDYADHEAAFLASAINCDEKNKRENPIYTIRVVAPTTEPVSSCGGLQTLPDYSFETIPENYAALVLVGGYGWADEKIADMVVPIVKNAIDKGLIIGGICDAASFLARHGFLENIKHTGNGLEQLKIWGGKNYNNETNYVNEQAVSDHNIVTANGTGYLEFTKELLFLLKVDTPEWIEMFYRFNKDGFVNMMRQINGE